MPTLPPTTIEGVESGTGSLSVGSDGLISREVELRFLVMCLDGYTAAEAKGQELAPLYYDGHRRGDIRCTPVGGGWYQIVCTYNNAGVDAYGTWGVENPDGVKVVPAGISVDTTGGTEHVTQALYAEFWEESGGQGTEDEARAVNVSGDQVNGISKTTPAFNFTETWLVPSWYLMVGAQKKDVAEDGEQDPGPTIPYAQKLRDLTGTVNKEKWRIFQKGEVLFLGARYDVSRGSSMVPVTFSFSVQKTYVERNVPDPENPGQNKQVPGLQIGSIQVYTKLGWDYYWVEYEDAVDTDGQRAFKRPKRVFVDQIYEQVDFKELGIGDQWGQHFLFTGETFAHPLDPAKNNIV
jgi:hypothetical protein